MSAGYSTSSTHEPTERTPLLEAVASNEAQETQLSGAVNAKVKSPGRQIALDLLRGLLMALMAIDHTSVAFNAYSHGTGMLSEAASQIIIQWNGNLAYTIRTMTHLCASGFTMLLGVGIAFFTESRLAQGMKPVQFLRHFFLRAFAIILVSLFAFGVLIIRPPHVYLNAILLALAIDYVLVGGLYLIIVFALEPRLSQFIKKILISRSTGTQIEVDATAKAITNHIINAVLLVAGLLTLWTNVWTSPHQGECHSAVSVLLSNETTQISPRCHLNRHFVFDFLFGVASCPNLHINSAFPPMGWLPFALFGLLYGRILIHGRLQTTSKVIVFNVTLSLVLALFFVSTRVFSYGNLTTHCLATPDQLKSPSSNQYLASFKSFFYIAKYPPSPSFAFFTLSACYMLIAFFTALSATFKIFNSPYNPLLVYGVQPLFFYGAHLILLLSLSGPILNSSLAKPMPNGRPDLKTGIGLGWTFAVLYILVLIVMYFACLQYSRFKLSRGRESVWRFL